MRSDSYSRYLRSDMYKDFLNGSKKKVTITFIIIIFIIILRNLLLNYIDSIY